MAEPNISTDWYRERAARYAEVASRMEQSVWCSRPWAGTA